MKFKSSDRPKIASGNKITKGAILTSATVP